MQEKKPFQRKISNRVKNRILLIENDAEFRTTLAKFLQKENYEIIAVENINQAGKYLDKFLFGLLIFGFNQPKGIFSNYLLQLVKHKQIPDILVLSAFNWNEIQTELEDIPVKEILIKPAKKETIIESIEKLKSPNL